MRFFAALQMADFTILLLPSEDYVFFTCRSDYGGVVSTPHFCFAIHQNLRSSPIQLIATLKLVGIVVPLLVTKY